jgi:hypothetical protein
MFDQPGSRVQVRAHPVWQRLRAVKIDAWVKVDALGARRNIVEGDHAFAFYIHPDGELCGTVFAPMRRGGAVMWHGVTSVQHAPDGVPRFVPVGQWVKLTYVHDGIASLRLYIDDHLVAAFYDLVSAVPAVGSHGVHIGNWPAGNQFPFAGAIDDVKIWRYDADAMMEQFFSRHTSAEATSAWAAFINQIGQLRADPLTWEQTVAYLRCTQEAQQDLIRAVRSQGEAAIQTAQDFARRYEALWRGGNISGPEMEELMVAWRDWLVGLVGEAYSTYLSATTDCWERYAKDLPLPQVDMTASDGDFAAYLQLITGRLL